MFIQYNMGNFKTGEVKRLISKESMETYIKLGFKLISVAWISHADFIKQCSKGMRH